MKRIKLKDEYYLHSDNEYIDVSDEVAEACPDHIQMFVGIPPKYGVSEIMGYLICNQLLEDYEYEQMILKEYIDTFTGEQVKKGKYKRLFRAKARKVPT